MNIRPLTVLASAAFMSLSACFAGSVAAEADPLSALRVPDGFHVELWADGVPDARSLSRSPDGTLFVGTRGGGKVYALRDADGDGRADRRWTLAEGLNMPNGVAWHRGDLYVAENHRILRYADIGAHLDAPPTPQVVRDDLPTETHHGWRYIDFGPDGKLYLAIGAPCNVCMLESFERDGRRLEYGSITRMNADGSHWEVVAHGVRNSVGFDWRPQTKELWFTDNGRDWLGDDKPSCELNRATRAGQHFGFPYCHAGSIADPEFGKGKACSDYVAPVARLGAHVAPLGMMFYTGGQFPAEYRGSVLIAEHGSWNRSEKSGYRIVRVPVGEQGEAGEPQPFVDGFLRGQAPLGRPVDLVDLPDGSVLFSDNGAGRIYRVRYGDADRS